MSASKVLIGRIHRHLSDLEAEYLYIQEQAKLAEQTGQDVYWTAVGFGMQGFYTGLEKAFEQIVREVDCISNLQSGQWHKALLKQMTLEVPDVRPPVIDAQTHQYLKAYLGFRHVVRSHYTHRLDPELIKVNFQSMASCYSLVSQQLREFCQFLESVD